MVGTSPQARALHFRVDFEHLISTISTHFIVLEPDSVNTAIDDALRRVGEFVDVDRVWYMEMGDEHSGTIAHEWCHEGVTPFVGESFSDEMLPYCFHRLRQEGRFYVEDRDLLPAEAKNERHVMAEQSIKTLVVLQIMVGSRWAACVGYDWVRESRTWEDPGLQLLRMLGEIVANALERARADREQKRLQAQLLQAQKLESIGLLAGGIAHDINNVLVAVMCNGELARAKVDRSPTEARRCIDEILSAAQRASEFTSQLLAFARVQQAPSTLTDISDGLATTMKLIRRLLPASIDIEVRRPNEPLTVRMQPGQLEQVLLNLCLNARDAMPSGGRLHITLHRAQLDAKACAGRDSATLGEYAAITVADDGTGMSADVRECVFDPFFTTKSTGEGTGLGLAVVYGIADQLRGFVDVESTPGEGTQMRVFLPLSNANVVEHSDEPEDRSGRQGSGVVLVADDDAAVRDLNARLLRDAGHTVFTASDGIEAERVFSEHASEISICVLDTVMPKLGGMALYERMLKVSPNLPCVFITGYDRGLFPDNYFDVAGRVLLAKPYRPRQLLQSVLSLLDESDRSHSPGS